jgi:hypothetical protein
MPDTPRPIENQRAEIELLDRLLPPGHRGLPTISLGVPLRKASTMQRKIATAVPLRKMIVMSEAAGERLSLAIAEAFVFPDRERLLTLGRDLPRAWENVGAGGTTKSGTIPATIITSLPIPPRSSSALQTPDRRRARTRSLLPPLARIRWRLTRARIGLRADAWQQWHDAALRGHHAGTQQISNNSDLRSASSSGPKPH